jgi:hypothetical protein
MLTFDRLIGASLIKGLYFIGLVAIALSAIFGIFYGFVMENDSVLILLGSIIFGPLVAAVWRFICELCLLPFRISDDLRDIRNQKLGSTLSRYD